METKTQKFKRLFHEQKYKEALGILKSFRKMIPREESRILNIAWECLTGHATYYQQLGFDIQKVKSEAYEIMLNYAIFK